MNKVLVTGGSGFIGAHLVDLLLSKGCEVVNVDCQKPANSSRVANWRDCSILDAAALSRVFAEFKPEMVVHLAAYAAVGAKSLADYAVNTEGTANVLAACQTAPSLKRVIITSTQHVRRPGSPVAKSDTDYAPYMFYGESKVITEQLTRSAKLPCPWVIIRPTTVWGPGQQMLADGLWRLIDRRKYFHPSKDPVLRSYGYVGNVVWQIEKLLHADETRANGKVFYVADGNILQKEWVDAFSVAMTGRPTIKVPVSFIHALAIIGDSLMALGVNFPMYSARYGNLVTPNPVPIEPTLELLGSPPYSLADGVAETVAWFRSRN